MSAYGLFLGAVDWKAIRKDMRRRLPGTIGWKPCVKSAWPLLSEGSQCAVGKAFIGVAAICSARHLLHPGLRKIEGKAAGRCKEASHKRSPHNCNMAIALKTSPFKDLLGLLELRWCAVSKDVCKQERESANSSKLP